MVCARLMPAVSGLESDFPGRVESRNVDSTSEEGTTAVRELGFQSHGIVVRDPQGRAIWKQADHAVSLDDVRTALRSLLDTTRASG